MEVQFLHSYQAVVKQGLAIPNKEYQMTKIFNLVDSYVKLTLDNTISGAANILTQDMAKQVVDAMEEYKLVKEIAADIVAEKKEQFDVFGRVYTGLVQQFSQFMQAEVERRFEEKNNK